MAFPGIVQHLLGQHQLQVGTGDVGLERGAQILDIERCDRNGVLGGETLEVPRQAVEQGKGGAGRGARGAGQGVADDDQFLHVHAPTPVVLLGYLRRDDGKMSQAPLCQLCPADVDFHFFLLQVEVVFQGILDAAVERPRLLCGESVGQGSEEQDPEDSFHG